MSPSNNDSCILKCRNLLAEFSEIWQVVANLNPTYGHYKHLPDVGKKM